MRSVVNVWTAPEDRAGIPFIVPKDLVGNAKFTAESDDLKPGEYGEITRIDMHYGDDPTGTEAVRVTKREEAERDEKLWAAWGTQDWEQFQAFIRKREAGAVREDEEPKLGCATTEELLAELHARAEMDGNLKYRTIDHDG